YRIMSKIFTPTPAADYLRLPVTVSVESAFSLIAGIHDAGGMHGIEVPFYTEYRILFTDAAGQPIDHEQFQEGFVRPFTLRTLVRYAELCRLMQDCSATMRARRIGIAAEQALAEMYGADESERQA